MNTFPIARYRLECRAQTALRLPDYAGSALRGAFGHALRRAACLTRQKDCSGCPLRPTCPYPAIFAPPPPAEHALQKFSAVPVPYVIEPPAWGSRLVPAGETFAFSLVLTGRALRELPLILTAWRDALARGIGAGDGRAELRTVSHLADGGETRVIAQPDDSHIATHDACIRLDGPPATAIRLHFHTPLRLQENGRALPPERLRPRTLLMALARRSSLVAEFHAGKSLVTDFAALREASERIADTKTLVWQDWTRYSSRQQQRMALGGVLGEWQLHGDLAPFLPLLKLGEWLHVGKETAFGLGGYTRSTATAGDTSIEAPNTCGCLSQAADPERETT